LTVKKAPDFSRETANAEETLALARRVGALLKPGDWVGLIGEMGSGKTVFVQGLAEALHLADPISSPTFSIVKTHRAKKGGIPLRHVDLYRLAPAEIPALEWEELHDDNGVTVVEWAEKAQYLWPPQCLPVRLAHLGHDARRLDFYVFGSRSEEILRRLKGTP
jgi:tRNA threonylcarbamoyladenosine biosynthesis protein TsaE